MTRIPPEPQPPRHVHFPPPEQMIEELLLELEELLLERIKLAARGSITREALLDGAAVKTMVDMLSDTLLLSLETAVLGHDRKTISWQLVEYRPDGWLQYLKRRHAPRWILKRWPVQMKRHERTLTLPVRSLYPEAPKPPGLGPVVFHSLERAPFSLESDQ